MSAADLSIAEAQAQLASGDLSSVELTEAVLARASMTEAQLHSFLHIDHAGARAAAEAADSKIADGTGGLLAGIPIALKDNMVTEGIETTCSSKILSGWVPPYDGALSQAMKAADAVMVGKTTSTSSRWDLPLRTRPLEHLATLGIRTAYRGGVLEALLLL